MFMFYYIYYSVTVQPAVLCEVALNAWKFHLWSRRFKNCFQVTNQALIVFA